MLGSSRSLRRTAYIYRVNMKPPFTYLSPTGAAFAAAIGISLALFPLGGLGVQVEPTPLLPSVGVAAERVAADLPATPSPRGPQAVTKVASSAQLGSARLLQSAPHVQVTSSGRRAHRDPSRVVVRT